MSVIIWLVVVAILDGTMPFLSAEEGLAWEDSDLIEQSYFRESVMGDATKSASCCDEEETVNDVDGWHLLPDGLLWHSYLAAPHEPRISTVIFQTNDEGIFWDATLGGRVGLLRYGTADAKHPSGWQWDLEGAAITRLDLLHAEDVESMDYRFGTEITAAEGPWAMKFGYFHISSHVGDEYLIRNPTFQRINYVTESWIVGGSYKPTDQVRLYGEFINSF